MRKLKVFYIRLPMILFWLIIIAATISNAQVRTNLLNPDKIFLSTGINSSSFYNSYITSELRKTKIGVTLQLGAVYSLTKNFDFGLNFLFERKGVRSRYEVSYYDPSIDSTNCQCTTSQGLTERNTSANYLIFTPQLKYKLAKNKILIGVGPYLGKIVKAKTTTTNFWDNSNYSANALDTFRKFDFGVSIVFEYNFLFHDSVYGFSILNNLGLDNINRTGNRTTTNTTSFNLIFNIK